MQLLVKPLRLMISKEKNEGAFLMKKIACLVILLLVLGGCGQTTVKQGAEIDINLIQGQLDNGYETLRAQHNIEVMETYVTDEGTLHLGIRKLYSFGEKMSEEEMNDIKETIFRLIGLEFPVDIFQCCLQEEADLSGKITSIDREHKRVLIVDNDSPNENKQMPRATWVNLTEDATIQLVESNQKLTFTDLKVGQQIEAWSVGLTLESYPSQTSVMRINILASEENSEDISGTITALEKEGTDFAEYKITVDNQEVFVGKDTTILQGDQILSIVDLQVGDQVKVWYLGYTLFEEQNRASQIMVNGG